MKTLGLIPARAGSRRLPRKNLRLLGGKPLVQWAIDTARCATTLDAVVVSSDDEAVLDLAASLDPSLPLPRPEALATDTSPAIDFIHHALGTLDPSHNVEVVVVIQPTSPFTRPDDIDSTVSLLHRTGASSAVTVVQVAHDLHPLKFKMFEGHLLRPFIADERGRLAAHQLPPVFVRNGSVYTSTRTAIDSNTIITDDCAGYVMPRDRSIDINDEVDLIMAELMLLRSTDASPQQPSSTTLRLPSQTNERSDD